MISGQRFACLLAAVLALGLAGPTLAATGQSHEGQGGPIELTLDHGGKWQTDGALRDGMAATRRAMGDALDRIHDGRYSPDEYAALARTLETNVDTIVRNCRLPEEADAQLHIVLAAILDGIETMKTGPDRVGGAMTIVSALDAYGSHFDHPGFEPFQR